MTQLSTLFIIIALLSYVAFRARLHQRPFMYGAGMLLTVGISGLMGVFSKENAALLPLYLLAVECIVFQWKLPRTEKPRSHAESTSRKNGTKAARHILIAFHAIFVVIPLSAALIYVIINWSDLTHGYTNRQFTLPERLLTEAHVVWFYLKAIIFPRVADMTLFHDAYPIQSQLDIATTAAFAGHAISLITMISMARKAPVLALGISVFYISHALESTFIPLELVFEHRNYLATWGIMFTLTYYIVGTPGQAEKLKFARYTTVVSIIALFSFMAHTRALTWQKEELITIAALEKYPNSVRALSHLANINLKRGSVEYARHYIESAVEAAPDQAGPALHLLFTYCKADSYPEELHDRIVHTLRTGIATVYAQNGAYSLAMLKNKGECIAVKTNEVAKFLLAFLENHRINNEIRYYLLLQLGRVYLADGQAEAARSSFNKATKYQSHAPYIHRLMALEGSVLSSIELKDMKSATKSLLEINALASDPRLKSIFNIEGTIENLEEIDDEALKLKAIKMAPISHNKTTHHPNS
ncbi:uncharacterized protein FOKN1_2645 [Thiohalobacter thiocyanaticus]|uniref:Tetratricopeptide repeat protein n=2 Tax=Thiohalobacter thiocyanaticus TaxID=585455 RepID=A0A1Z4VU77_9GAMM|nr:uncharacterized protein FOKN1_2645 [Thiohalobacter thiocyanaticus]